MIYAYYTPHIASPVNEKRAGTSRIGWDDPQPIQITAGYDNYLLFSFRDENQRRVFLRGRTLTGKIFNHEGVEIFSDELDILSTEESLAKLTISKMQSNVFVPGLYSLVLSHSDDRGIEEVIGTARSKFRFVIDIIDFSANC